MKRRRNTEEGFTLIEIMVVILILGLLATIVVQSLRGATDKAKRTKAMADLHELQTALDRYYLDSGFYPTTDQGLQALVSPPSGGRVPANYEDGGYIQRVPPIPGVVSTSTRVTAAPIRSSRLGPTASKVARVRTPTLTRASSSWAP